MKNNSVGKILIGRVTSAHGLAGEINILPLTDFPERFEAMEFLSLYKNGKFFRELEIFNVRAKAGGLTLATNLEDRNAAEECVGAEIMIDPDERVELEPEEFWVDDLIGLQVEELDGRVLGTVTDFLCAGSSENELYEVRDPDGKLHYIPAVKEFIREIEPEKGRIRVKLIDGLWD